MRFFTDKIENIRNKIGDAQHMRATSDPVSPKALDTQLQCFTSTGQEELDKHYYS
ncbi:hypothetical protein [Cetobacterium sp.]|uniref:hypothetical protein n=1 Tax=Cetobacterium sp. TaxID=2071632 RepID=UPI003F67A13B